MEKEKFIIECPLCLEEFNNPLILPCGHSFCEECIRKISKDNEIACPICRRYYNLNIINPSRNISLMELQNEFKLIKRRILEQKGEIEEKNKELENLKEQFLEKEKNMEIKMQEHELELKKSEKILEDKILEVNLQEKKILIEKKQNDDEIIEKINKNNEESQRLKEVERDIENKAEEKFKAIKENEKELLVKIRELQLKEILLTRRENEYNDHIQETQEKDKDFAILLNNSKQLNFKNEQLALENIDLKAKLLKLTEKLKFRTLQLSPNQKKKPKKTSKFSKDSKKTKSLYSTL